MRKEQNQFRKLENNIGKVFMKKKEIAVVYSAGLAQGIALVAFPAASTIFTNPHKFNFSNTDYGSLFIPQVVIAIIASAISMKLSKYYGSKLVFICGLLANLMAMVLLAFSAFVMHDHFLAYGTLLFATGFLGLGFGLTVPTLNTMTALLYPEKVDSTILTLNALLGVGTALAPVFIAIFIGLGFWWGLPSLVAILILLVLLVSYPLTLPGGNIKTSLQKTKFIPISYHFWIFAAFALLYGIIETLNGNWVSIYMSKHENANIVIQSMALTAFWGMVTLGRIFFALIEKKFKEQKTYQILPFVAALAFVLIALLPPKNEYLGVFAFGLAGIGCSALLPLTISFGNSITPSSSGGIIAFYLVGYGVAAFGVGSLQETANLNLQEIYAAGAVIALLLGVIASFIIKSLNMLKSDKCQF
jgi:MFS family permease